MNRPPNHRPALALAVLIAAPLSGCTTTGHADRDGLAFHERREIEAARADVEPGAWARTKDAGAFVFRDVPQWVWERLRGQTPIDYARQLESPLASQRRAALLNLAGRDFGDGADYVTVYKAAALNDPDPMVRAAGLRALNLARAEGEAGVFVSALGDEVPAVRLEAAKALANCPHAEAKAPLLAMLEGDADVDNRIAAAEALRHYPDVEVARRLANATGDEDFGLAWQAADSLSYLTGQELAYDPARWLAYLAAADDPFG